MAGPIAEFGVMDDCDWDSREIRVTLLTAPFQHFFLSLWRDPPCQCRNLIKKPWVLIGVPYMNPNILGVIRPGFLNQVPTLALSELP